MTDEPARILSPEAQGEALGRVIETVDDLTRREVSSVVIFDLDGTLLDNRPRTYYIMREAAELLDDTPQLRAAMTRVLDLDTIHYSLEETLRGMGVDDESEHVLVIEEWKKRFFTDRYQRFDVPHAGARRFVDAVHRAGATVIYLTGRDRERMLVGMIDSLRQYGFPVGIVGTMTITKADMNQDDETFKKETLDYLKRLGTVVATFENEPGNANLLQAQFPAADNFLLATQHSPGAAVPHDGLVHIRDFQY